MGMISKICLSFARSEADFLDLRQDVLMNLWRGWGKFRGQSKRSTWIYRVALNTCMTSIKQKPAPDPRNLPLDFALHLPVAVDEAEAENLNELYRLISELKPEDKAVIMLWLDEFSYDEIAEMMGFSRNTVAQRIKRAIEKLVRISEKKI